MYCGLYEIDITPHLGMDIPGYFESRPSTGIRDRLMARRIKQGKWLDIKLS